MSPLLEVYLPRQSVIGAAVVDRLSHFVATHNTHLFSA
jgi:hypothetical protein